MVLLFWLLGGVAQAQEQITDRAYHEDPQGLLTIEDIQRVHMTHFEGVLSLGYGGPVWVRLAVHAQDKTNSSRLYVRGRPSYLDEVILYDPAVEPTARLPVGDRYPVSAQDMPSALLIWNIEPAETPRYIWLRVNTTSTRLVHFEVLPEDALHLSNARVSQLGAMYIGLISIFCLWAIAQLILRHDGLIAVFLLSQILSMGFGSGLLGFTRLLASPGLSPEAIDHATNLFSISSAAGALLFSWRLMEETGPSNCRRYLLWLLFGAYVGVFALLLSGQVRTALNLSMIFLLLGPPGFFLVAVFCKERQPDPSDMRYGLNKTAILFYFMAGMIFSLLTALPGLGLVPAGEFSIYIVLLYSVSIGTLMIGTLQYRSHLLLQRQSALARQAEVQKLQAQQERRLRLERESILDMLGHELRTPMSTVRMMTADRTMPELLSKRIGAAVQDMTKVLDLALQTGQLEDGSLPIHPVETDLKSLLEQVLDGQPEQDRIRWINTDRATRDGIPVQTDPVLLSLVVRNLLDNALKYSTAGTQVDIDLRGPDPAGKWGLTVSNEVGRAGLPDPDRVFQKYYRSKKAAHRTGSGLGLFLSRGIARRLGADLVYIPDDKMVRFRLEAGSLPPSQKEANSCRTA